MESREFDSLSDDQMVDRQISRLAADLPNRTGSAEMESRVFTKVRRRKRALRTGYAVTALIALAAISLSSLIMSRSEPADKRLARESTGAAQFGDNLEDLGLADVDSGFLAAPPPVVALGLISDDQIAMLDCLESLAEEFK